MASNAEYLREWRKRNPRYWERQYRKRRELVRAIRDEAKKKPCADCGNEYPPYVMQFDHVRGEKLFMISETRQAKMSIAKLHAEIAKCDVVCANCHSIRTHGKDHAWKGIK